MSCPRCVPARVRHAARMVCLPLECAHGACVRWRCVRCWQLVAGLTLAACCGFDLCHKYILYLFLYLAVFMLRARAFVGMPTTCAICFRCCLVCLVTRVYTIFGILYSLHLGRLVHPLLTAGYGVLAD